MEHRTAVNHVNRKGRFHHPYLVLFKGSMSLAQMHPGEKEHPARKKYTLSCGENAQMTPKTRRSCHH